MAGPVPFVGGSYPLKRKKADTQRTINMVPTVIESGDGKANARMFLQSIAGLRQFSAAPLPPAPPPPPPPPPHIIGTSSGGTTLTDDGRSPTLPTGTSLLAGDGMILVICYFGGYSITPSFVTPGWSVITVRADSSGTIGYAVCARIATGTSADANMTFSVATGQTVTWQLVTIPNVTDSAFPSTYVGTGRDYATASDLTPPPVYKVGTAATQVCVSGVLLYAPASGASVTGTPAGFTSLGTSINHVIAGAQPYNQNLSLAYKVALATTSVTPGAFVDGNGSYFSGGFASFSVLVTADA